MNKFFPSWRCAPLVFAVLFFSVAGARFFVARRGHPLRYSSWKTRGGGPITLVEFGDYHCYYSGQFQNVLRQARNKFPGRFTFVYKHFAPHYPGTKTMFIGATLPGEAVECAADQERFWDFHDRLYAEAERWKAEIHRTAYFIDLAGKMGLNQKQFGDCMRSHAKRALVEQDTWDGVRAGIQGTPTLLLEGKREITRTIESLSNLAERGG